MLKQGREETVVHLTLKYILISGVKLFDLNITFIFHSFICDEERLIYYKLVQPDSGKIWEPEILYSINTKALNNSLNCKLSEIKLR